MGPWSSALFAAAKNYVAVHGCKGAGVEGRDLAGRRGECQSALKSVDYAPQVLSGRRRRCVSPRSLAVQL
jgi:hypothetical protein